MHRFWAFCLLSVLAIVSTSNRAAWADGRLTPPEEVEVDPLASAEHNSLGLEAVGAGRFGDALREFTAAIKFDPENGTAWNNRAFFRASCAEARYRDGAKAVADATRACELQQWTDSSALDTLAAAHAEKGNFDEAQKWQAKAIKLAAGAAESRGMKSRLELYKAGKPYHDAPKKAED